MTVLPMANREPTPVPLMPRHGLRLPHTLDRGGRGWVHLRAVIDVVRLPVRRPLLLPAGREGPRRRRRCRRARLRWRLVVLVLVLLVRRRLVLLVRRRGMDDGRRWRRGGQLDRDHLPRVGAGRHGDRQLLAAVVHIKLPAAGVRACHASAVGLGGGNSGGKGVRNCACI